MTFATQKEAKAFLVAKVVSEAERQEVTFTADDKRLLSYSESDPETLVDAPLDRLFEVDYEWEKEVTSLLRAAYLRDKDGPEGELYKEAYRKLNEGDHYILVMAKPALQERRPVRDAILYVVIALLVVVGAVVYPISTSGH